MGAPSIPNKTTALALNRKISEGVEAYFSKLKSINLGGTTYTPKSLMEVLNAEDAASSAVDSSRAQYLEDVANHRTSKVAAKNLRAQLKTYIVLNYGNQAIKMLGDFGMKAPKSPGNKTVEAKAKALEQSRATREARHTMGKKEKLSIKGVVPSTEATATAPSPSAPAATPAQAAPASPPAQTTPSH